MRGFVLLFLFLLPSVLLAEDAPISHYMQANINMLQTQVSQLYEAIALLQESGLSDQEKFERIAEPSFSAIDQVLAEFDFTVLTFYQFQVDHAQEIEGWLDENLVQAAQFYMLKTEHNQLVDEYDRLISRP